MTLPPAARMEASLPRPRRAGFLSKPHRTSAAVRWRFALPTDTHSVLCPGDPFHDEAGWLSRRTPSGLTETELLASLNYLDAAALVALEGIGPVLASGILSVREEFQYFSSLDELALVPRIGARRFVRLVGRPPRANRFRLHDLMRLPRGRDILVSDLQPWSRPAPNVFAIHLQPPGAPPPAVPEGQTLVTESLRRFRLLFICSGPINTGRAAFLHRTLPVVIRSLLS